VAGSFRVTRPQSRFSSPSVTMGRDQYIDEAHMFEMGRAAVLKFLHAVRYGPDLPKLNFRFR